MNKLLLFFAFIGLLSCQPDEEPAGVAVQTSGRYLVTAYIVFGDTLFSLVPNNGGLKQGINKIGVDNFAVSVDAIGSDQISINTSYWRNGSRVIFNKEATVSLTDYQYQLSPVKGYVPSIYEGKIERFTKVLYERTVGGGLLIPPTDSPINSNQPSSQDIVIVAQPQR